MNLSFDGNTSLSDAQELTRRVWRIYESADAAPKPCERPANEESDDKAWTAMRTRYRLDPAMTELEVTVTTEGNSTEVMMSVASG